MLHSDWLRYSLQVSRKMPLVPRMLEELVFALPPLANGRVCDLASGNGNAAVKIKAAYPRHGGVVVVVVVVEMFCRQCYCFSVSGWQGLVRGEAKRGGGWVELGLGSAVVGVS